MANYQVVDRPTLKDALNKEAKTLAPNGQVMIGSARIIKGDINDPESKKLQLQFIQVRNLTGAKKSIMSLANKGDDRFNLNNTQILRNWMPINVEGGKEVFGLDFQSMFDQALTLKDTDELFIGHIIDTINGEGGIEVGVKIQAKETTNIERLPRSIRESVKAQDEYADTYKLQAPTEDGGLEDVVDENGLPVYRWTELVTDDTPDVLVPNKKSLSRFIEEGGIPQESSAVVAKPAGKTITI